MNDNDFEIKKLARRFVDSLDTQERLVASREANRTLFSTKPRKGFDSGTFGLIDLRISDKLQRLLDEVFSEFGPSVELSTAIQNEAKKILKQEQVIELREGKDYSTKKEDFPKNKLR